MWVARDVDRSASKFEEVTDIIEGENDQLGAFR